MREDNFKEVQVSRNMRYLLWKKEVPKINWAPWLSSRLGWQEEKVKNFLAGQITDDQMKPEELNSLSIELGLVADGSELRFEDLVNNHSNLLQENLQYLFNGLEHGKKKNVAKKLGVSPTTISRWLSGVFEPRESVLRQLVLYFGLVQDTDLKATPVFLSLEPVTQIERRAWLVRQIKKMNPIELNTMYPALHRLLET